MRHVVVAALAGVLLAGCFGPPGPDDAVTGGTTGQSTTSQPASSSTSAASGSTGQGTSATAGNTNGGTNGSTIDGTNGTGSTTSGVGSTSAGSGFTTGSDVGSTSAGSGTNGTTGTCSCATDSDCPTPYACVNAQCLYTYSTSTSGGGTGGASYACPGDPNQCGCSSDSDCNDAYHQGFVCFAGICQAGPSTGTTNGTGGACANGGSSTNSTTGGGVDAGPAGGGEGLGCACSSDADCQSNGPSYWGLVCQNGTCEVGPNGGVATGTSGGSAGACSGSSTTSTTGGGTSGTTGLSAGGSGGASTPLVFSFDARPVSFTQASGRFELTGRGPAIATDWVSARTPWLALDRNGNGRIDDGEELFGSMTRLADGTRAKNGFEALAALDANHDGVLDARDPAFAKLVLWTDANQDRASQPAELVGLARAGVVSISLGYATAQRCDARGNCEQERASFEFRDGRGLHRGELVDVWLAHRDVSLAAK